MSWRGYAIVGIGTALTFAGALQILRTVGIPQLAFAWGVVGVVGVLVLTYGTVLLVARSRDNVRNVDPEGAPRRTDSWDGRK